VKNCPGANSVTSMRNSCLPEGALRAANLEKVLRETHALARKGGEKVVKGEGLSRGRLCLCQVWTVVCPIRRWRKASLNQRWQAKVECCC